MTNLNKTTTTPGVGLNVELDTELGAISDFFSKLLAKQEPLGHDFEKVLYENLWDLYVPNTKLTGKPPTEE
mgnify:CR=1 FL=1